MTQAASFRNDARLLSYVEAVCPFVLPHPVPLTPFQVNSAELHRDPAQWRRFVFHADHVHGTTHRPSAGPAVNDAIRLLIQAVITQNGGTTILPLLRSIVWLYPVDDTLTPFFTATLR